MKKVTHCLQLCRDGLLRQVRAAHVVMHAQVQHYMASAIGRESTKHLCPLPKLALHIERSRDDVDLLWRWLQLLRLFCGGGGMDRKRNDGG